MWDRLDRDGRTLSCCFDREQPPLGGAAKRLFHMDGEVGTVRGTGLTEADGKKEKGVGAGRDAKVLTDQRQCREFFLYRDNARCAACPSELFGRFSSACTQYREV